jgi:hypothetical protein
LVIIVNIFFFEPNIWIRLTIRFIARYARADATSDAIVASCTGGYSISIIPVEGRILSDY